MGTVCCDQDTSLERAESNEERLRKFSDCYSTVEGHTGMTFIGPKLIKVTKESEARNYMCIFSDDAEESLVKLRPFLPKFYGAQ